MILKIKEALDTIKPDEDLLRNTELILRTRKLKKNTQLYQKLSIAACLVFIVGSMSVSGYCYYQYPVNYLDIDINPSLELDVNRFNRVVDVKYFNEDAENLIGENSLDGFKSEDAVAMVVEAASNNGYISQDKATVVSIAVTSNESNGNSKSAVLLETCAETIENKYSNIAVYSATVSSDLKKEADSASISAGKLSLIKMIQSLDQTATVDKYKDDSVSNIFNKLTYLTSDANMNVSKENKDIVIDGIKGVNKQIERSKEKQKVTDQPSPSAPNQTQVQPHSHPHSNNQNLPESNQTPDRPDNRPSVTEKGNTDSHGKAPPSVQPTAKTKVKADENSKADTNR